MLACELTNPCSSSWSFWHSFCYEPCALCTKLHVCLRKSCVAGNLLRGTIPANLSQLTGLQYLRLGQNRLSGSIPAVLFQKLVGVSVLALVGR